MDVSRKYCSVSICAAEGLLASQVWVWGKRKLCVLEARRSVLLHSDVILFILKGKVYEVLVYLKDLNHN